jgi:hypothetical protein
MISSKALQVLSYVWGSVVQPPTEGIGPLPEQLGLTLENAITATQKLGFKYLWADSVSIDQRNAVEKHDQIGLMHRIYHGAFATIIALDSADANSGIPGVRDDRTLGQLWAEFGNNRMLSRLPLLPDELSKSLWATRVRIS